ncbi:NUDIX domain-containing protein [Planktotalea sp.]|uniref:NUDIX domain-containing protein n=1 Tax=Planktotalea sp. TaxID=2029877 RepID=UPI003D6B0CF1
MIRRFGTLPKKDTKYRSRPGAYAVLVRNDQILLTFQQHPTPEFQLPGGGIDPHENTIPALRREIMEETGWTIGAPRRLGAFKEFTFMPEYNLWAEKICHVYFARPSRQVCDPTEEGHTSHLVSVEEAARLVPNKGSRHFLNQAICALR